MFLSMAWVLSYCLPGEKSPKHPIHTNTHTHTHTHCFYGNIDKVLFDCCTECFLNSIRTSLECSHIYRGIPPTRNTNPACHRHTLVQPQHLQITSSVLISKLIINPSSDMVYIWSSVYKSILLNLSPSLTFQVTLVTRTACLLAGTCRAPHPSSPTTTPSPPPWTDTEPPGWPTWVTLDPQVSSTDLPPTLLTQVSVLLIS